MNRPGGPEEYSPGREAGATDKQSDRGPEGRKIDSHNLTPLRGWVQNGSKTPAFGRGYILSALRAYSFTPSTRLNAADITATVRFSSRWNVAFADTQPSRTSASLRVEQPLPGPCRRAQSP